MFMLQTIRDFLATTENRQINDEQLTKLTDHLECDNVRIFSSISIIFSALEGD